MAKPTVLIVDDEPDLVELVTLTLERMNLADRAGQSCAARELLNQRHFDLCLTDMRLPDGDGLIWSHGSSSACRSSPWP
jgi:two-component system response regulator PilR (NtrC family)